MADELNRSTEKLWRDYEFLTNEIRKIAELGDDKLVIDLINQRERLQAIIEEKNDKAYVKSPEGKALLATILAESKKATEIIQKRYNHLKQQHRLSQTYEETQGTFISEHHFFDTQT